MSNLGAAAAQDVLAGAQGLEEIPEWQKTLNATLAANAAASESPIAKIPVIGPAYVGAAGLAGGLFREPTPETPPASIVTGPPGAPPPPQIPQPAQVVQQIVAGAQGPNLAPLGAQARKIGAIGQGAANDAARAKEGLNEAADTRKEATAETVGVQQQKAQVQQLGLDDQLNEGLAYKKRYDDIRRGEEEAVSFAKEQHNEALEDSKYAGVSSSKRKELQTILNSPGATDVQKASAKAQLEKAQNIDPDQYLGTTGRKITSIIAQALGAFGASLAHTPNFAMQAIQKAIEDNMDAQRANFAKKEREAVRSKEGITEARETSEAAKHNAATEYAIGLDLVKKKVEKQIAGLEGSEAAAKGKEIIAMIDEERAKTDLAIDQQARSTFLQSATAQGNLMANQAGLQQQGAELEAKKKAGANEAAAQAANLAARGFTARPGLQLSTEEVKKVSEIAGNSGELLDAVGRLKELRQAAMDDPKKLGSPEFRAAAETAFKQAQVAYKSGASLGTWDKGSAELLESIFGKDPSGIGFIQARYDEIERSARASRDRKLESFGVMRMDSEAMQAQQRPPGARQVGQ